MVDVVGISTEWEKHIRAVKRGIIRALSIAPDFTGVYVSEDIADAIQRDTGLIAKVVGNTTFERTPLFVDKELPNQTVIYTWEAK